VEINRVWAMPNRWTFSIPPIAALLERYDVGDGWADPFAGKSNLCAHTNDMNDDMPASSHLDAVEFIKGFASNSLDGIVLDPPYSLHQSQVTYQGYGERRVIALTPVYDNAARAVRNGGHIISFGFGSNGVSKKRGAEIVEVLLVAHGGHHNDTIVTVERMNQHVSE
jgi:hypothetical protein